MLLSDVQARAASAMIKISKKYPLDTPRYLLVTVGTLLEVKVEDNFSLTSSLHH